MRNSNQVSSTYETMNLFEYYSRLKDAKFKKGLSVKGEKKLSELRDDIVAQYPNILEKTKGGRRIKLKDPDRRK